MFLPGSKNVLMEYMMRNRNNPLGVVRGGVDVMQAMASGLRPNAQAAKQTAMPAPAQPEQKKPGFLEGNGVFGIPKEALFMGGAGLLAGNRHNGAQLALQGFAGGMQSARQRQEQAKQQAKMDKFKEGLTPEQAMLFDVAPQAVAQGMAGRMFAEPAGPEYFKSGDDIIGVHNGQSSMVYDAPDAPVERWEPINPPAGQDGYWERSTTTGKTRRVGSGQTINVNTGTDGTPYRSISEVPLGDAVPLSLVDGYDIPDGMFPVRDGSRVGFGWEPIGGSEASRKAESRSDNTTVSSLINSYATLHNNKAIVSTQNTAGENIAGIYSNSIFGRLQDKVGGDIGNADNDAARDTIQGLSMNALMKMISMSDVSAKAMDSDAEMKAWLSSIKSDNFESALLKLHVLDTSFQDGQALRQAFENQVIDANTYLYVTQRAQTDPMAVAMAKRAQQYAGLADRVGTENMTTDELVAAEGLLEFMDPEDRKLFTGGK